jgi:hypothetical protein
MPPLPPLKDVLEALQQLVLPGAAGAALVMCVFLLLGRWSAATASVVAVAAGFFWANFTNTDIISHPADWQTEGRIPWKPDDPPKVFQWFPQASLVLMAVGLISRWFGMLVARGMPERYWWGTNAMVWLPRVGAIFAVSGWLVIGLAAEKPEWANLRWELAGAILLLWIVLDGVARDGISAEVSAYLGAALFAGAAILLYSRNGRFMDLAVIVGSAMFGIAAATGLVKSNPNAEQDPNFNYNPNPELFDARRPDAEAEARLSASGAIPAAVVFLVSLVLGTRPSHAPHQVPVMSFWLVTLAPLVLAPFLIPRVSRQKGWLLVVLRAVLVLAPLVAAIVMAGKHEQLPFQEEPKW